MTTTIEVAGRSASAGIAIGALYALGSKTFSEATARHPSLAGDQWLARAIEKAGLQLEAISASLADNEEAGIIDFQIAMLADEELSAPAFAEIKKNKPVMMAWRQALDSQINDYRRSDDEYFSARAADLEDICDRVIENLQSLTDDQRSGDMGLPQSNAVIVAEDLSPSRFLEFDQNRIAGIVLRSGSHLSHVAILARARAIPMLVATGKFNLPEQTEAIVDADTGKLFMAPNAELKARYTERMKQQSAQRLSDSKFLPLKAKTVDGEVVKVLLNVSGVEELRSIDSAHCDGIGLMRSEFLLSSPQVLHSEDEQYSAYRRLLEWADGRPVTIRTLDAGGDKPIDGLTVENESNPFLGVRGIRLSLQNVDVFSVQCRALSRAAVHGSLNVMFPMVSHVSEFTLAMEIFDRAIQDLSNKGVTCSRPRLGIMLEVPTAVVAIESFRAAEFFSVGSNDLVHYLSATSRDDDSLQNITEACEDVMWDLIRNANDLIAGDGRNISVCGDAAGDADKIERILSTGVRSLSVSTARLAATKSAISRINLIR